MNLADPVHGTVMIVTATCVTFADDYRVKVSFNDLATVTARLRLCHFGHSAGRSFIAASGGGCNAVCKSSKTTN